MIKSRKNFQLNTENTDRLDAHQLTLSKQVDIVFDENSKLIHKNFFLKFTDGIVWAIASIVLPLVNYCLYGLHIHGFRNVIKAKERGKGIVTIANHCMIMDSTMCADAMYPSKIYLPTVEETLKIPKVRFIVKALHAIPIPSNPKGLAHFASTCEELLRKGNIVHFFPEGSLWPWYKQLRPFKVGAFRFAVNTDSSILPMAITFRPRKGIWKLLGKKPLVNMTILPYLTANKVYRPKRAIQDLQDRSFAAMSKLIPIAALPKEND